MYLFLETFIVILFCSVSGIKVKERFKNIPVHHLIFGITCLGRNDIRTAKFGDLSLDYLAKFQKHLNYSLECFDVLEFGSPSGDGTYDGIIGLIQSNRTNTYLAVFPFDSVPFEPGYQVQSPMPAFAPYIYSVKIRGKNRSKLDLLHLFTNFDIPEWLYFLITLTLSTTFAVLIRIMYQRKFLRSKKKMLMAFFDHWFDHYMLIVDTSPSIISRIKPINVLWTMTVIAIFYGIHLLFMNTLSADLTANESDKWIKNLADLLYDPTFTNYTPTVSSHLNMLRVLSKSIPGTNERVLYDRIIHSNLTVHFGYSLESMGGLIIERFTQLMNGTRAFIEDSSFIDTLISQYFCHFFPEKEKLGDIVKSDSPLYSAPMSVMLSYSTHPRIVQIFNYNSRTTVEFGIMQGIFAHKVDRAMEEAIGVSKNIIGFQCADSFEGKLMDELEKDWDPLPLSFIARFIHICDGIILFAAIVLIIEKVWWRIFKPVNSGTITVTVHLSEPRPIVPRKTPAEIQQMRTRLHINMYQGTQL